MDASAELLQQLERVLAYPERSRDEASEMKRTMFRFMDNLKRGIRALLEAHNEGKVSEGYFVLRAEEQLQDFEMLRGYFG